jgi:hypothetical protein
MDLLTELVPFTRTTGNNFLFAIISFNIRTQDFGATTCPAVTNKIYSGSHIFQNSGKTKFLTTFYDSKKGTPSQASVYIDGTNYPLTLDLGSAYQGTYIYEGTSGSACRSYYFYFVDSSG